MLKLIETLAFNQRAANELVSSLLLQGQRLGLLALNDPCREDSADLNDKERQFLALADTVCPVISIGFLVRVELARITCSTKPNER